MRVRPLASARRGLLVALAPLLAATLGGCLLPQPDTPPIPPGNRPNMGVGAPNVRPGPTQDATLATPAPEATPIAATAPASPGMAAGTAPPSEEPNRMATILEGRIVGATATRITAVADAKGAAGALVEPDAEGRFTLPLAPGRYTLEITLADGVLIATPAVEVTAAGPNRIVVTIAGTPKAATVAAE